MGIFALASLGYIAAQSVQPILALRLFHGIGMGLFPTAATVVIAELAPATRRGEAMGWFGITNSLGLILGPVVGPAVAARLGFPALFLSAAGAAGLGMACICLVPAAERPAPLSRLPRPGDLFSPAAVLPSLILLLLYIPYGTVVAFIPLVATSRGIANPGLFYAVFAVAMLLVRAKAGRGIGQARAGGGDRAGDDVTGLSFLVLGVTTAAGRTVGRRPFSASESGARNRLSWPSPRTGWRPRSEARPWGRFTRRGNSRIASGAAGAGWLLNVTDFAALFLVRRRHSNGWGMPCAEGGADPGRRS